MMIKKVFQNNLKLGDMIEYPDIDGKTKYGIFIKRENSNNNSSSTVYSHRIIILFTEGKFFKKAFDGYTRYINSNLSSTSKSTASSWHVPSTPSVSTATSYFSIGVDVKITSSMCL